MSKTLFRTLVGILVGVVILLTVGYFVKWYATQFKLGMESTDFTYFASDVVGTHSGTSTTGVLFNNNLTSTSTYIKRISTTKNNATWLIKATAASTTGAKANFELFGSNDDFCDATATSTTDVACVGDCVLTSDINWYSAGDTVLNRTHLSYLTSDSATSLLAWATPSSTLPGPQVTLWNLNYECLRIDVAASSTALYVGLITK